MYRTIAISWIVVVALCLGGCGVRKLNAETRARLDTIGIAPAQYRAVTIVPPAPATRSALVGQAALHYGQTTGSYGSLPMIYFQGTPLFFLGATLSVLSSGVGATYGSVAGLLHPLPDPAEAQQKTADLKTALVDLDLQQQLATIFLAEAVASPHHFKLLREIGPLRLDLYELAVSQVPPVARPPRSAGPPVAVESYEELSTMGINAVLELAVDKLQFSGTEEALTLVLFGRARLLMPRNLAHSPKFRVVGTFPLDRRSEPHPYQDWSAADGALLQSVLAEELHGWSREVVAHWFE